jgi:hypothetical protein
VVVDLVFWSFVIALIPVALGLAWELISGLGAWIGRGLSGPSRMPSNGGRSAM